MTNKIKKRNNKRNNTGIPESRIFNFHQLKIKLKLDLPIVNVNVLPGYSNL